jgi:hypothetical protein
MKGERPHYPLPCAVSMMAEGCRGWVPQRPSALIDRFKFPKREPVEKGNLCKTSNNFAYLVYNLIEEFRTQNR